MHNIREVHYYPHKQCDYCYLAYARTQDVAFTYCLQPHARLDHQELDYSSADLTGCSSDKNARALMRGGNRYRTISVKLCVCH